jgi:O-antigen/teichoic acid export membrane protein
MVTITRDTRLHPARVSRRWLRDATGKFGMSGMVWLPAAETVNRGARFGVGLLLARSLGPGLYGEWVTAAALGMMLTAGGDLGLSTAVTRRIAGDGSRARTDLANILALTPLLVLLAAALLLSFDRALDVAEGRWLLLLGAGGMLECLALLVIAPLRGNGRVGPEATVRILQGIALICGGVALAAAHADAVAYAALFAATGAGSLVLATAAAFASYGATRPRLDMRWLAELLPEALPIFASVSVVLLYFRIDVFLIAAFRDASTTGVYGAAYNVAFGLSFVPMMLGRVLLPRFASASADGTLPAAFTRGLKVVAAAALLSTCALLVAMPVVGALYGASFDGIYAPYSLLALAQALFYLTHVFYVVLLARKRTAVVWFLTTGTLVLNVVMNLALIPALGASGAALAIVASESALLVAQAAIVRPMLRLEDGGRAARRSAEALAHGT